jgi:VanZ family protein
VATHLPPPAQPAPIPYLDKLAHFSVYTLLSWMFCVRWHPNPVNIVRVYPKIFLWLAFYGAMDEITQPYFLRTAEGLDYMADICGILVGIALYQLRTP